MIVLFHLLWISFFFLILFSSSHFFLKNASKIGKECGISEISTGIFILAFGTSLPELAVSIQSVFAEQANISIGNIIGSNICNLSLILGVALILSPLYLKKQIKADFYLLIILFAIQSLILKNQILSLFEGSLLLLGLFFYLKKTLNLSKISKKENSHHKKFQSLLISFFSLIISLYFLFFSSEKLINHSVSLASHFQISSMIIGLSIVALGTSLPELATVIVTAKQGKQELIIGNIIGSCFFNSLAILGLMPFLGKIEGINLQMSDIFALIAIPLFVVISKEKLGKIKGLSLILFYLLYCYSLKS